VVLNAVYNGSDTDHYGQIKHGFELTGTIDRSNFGLTFNLQTGKGNVLISNEIKIIANVQMIEQTK
jgi:polyisoprenoid-binding protein YceI